MRLTRGLPAFLLAAAIAAPGATHPCPTEKPTGGPTPLVWSPSGNQAAFTTGRTDCPTELQELDLQTATVKHLLQARPDADPEADLSCLHDVKYSPDGALLYFVTPAWATSGAIHVLDRRSGKVGFVIDGGPYLVIGTGPLTGMLIVVRRKYPEDMDHGPDESPDLVDPKTGTARPLAETLPDLADATPSALRTLLARKGWVSW